MAVVLHRLWVTTMNKPRLIFTLALNGYHLRYRQCIAAQRQYAERVGAEYLAVTKPSVHSLCNEVAWLKLYLIRDALQCGYAEVMFIDADAQPRADAPDFSEAMSVGKSIFAANGYSGRINSGVLVFRAGPESLAFLNRVIAAMTMTLPQEDEVGWGENGHIIHFLKTESRFQRISSRWNNNYCPQMDDYIRHYSAGPLRDMFKPRLSEVIGFYGYRIIMRLLRSIAKAESGGSPSQQLEALCKAVRTNLPRNSALSTATPRITPHIYCENSLPHKK